MELASAPPPAITRRGRCRGLVLPVINLRMRLPNLPTSKVRQGFLPDLTTHLQLQYVPLLSQRRFRVLHNIRD